MAESHAVLLELNQPRLLGRREVLQRCVCPRQQRTRAKGVSERIAVIERRDQQQRLRQRRQLTRSCRKAALQARRQRCPVTHHRTAAVLSPGDRKLDEGERITRRLSEHPVTHQRLKGRRPGLQQCDRGIVIQRIQSQHRQFGAVKCRFDSLPLGHQQNDRV
jgi:hypothetical protein